MANKPLGDPDNGGLRLDTGPATQLGQTPPGYQQIIRENFWLREVIEARLTAQDTALKLLQAFADRSPTTNDVQHEVARLREVAMQKFDGIKTQFSERDTQLDKASQNLDAQTRDAFAAAKEAVGEQNKANAMAIAKSEAAFTKQIDLLTDTIKALAKQIEDKSDANSKAMDGKLADIKERITIIESKTSVSDPSTAITLAKLDATVARLTSTTDFGTGKSAGQLALWALIAGMIGLLLGAGSLVGRFVKAAH